MLVYIDNGSSSKVAVDLSKIYFVGSISEIESEDKKKKSIFRFNISTSKGLIYSRSYSTRQEAEMVQFSTVTLINALEIFYERCRHIPEDRVTPVYFQAIDTKEKKLVPGKIFLYEQSVYTIVI